MSYHTYFDGRFTVTPILTAEQVSTLKTFADTRHCSPNDYNDHEGFPSLWCEWRPSDDGTTIHAEDLEDASFWNYEEWLIYLIDHFLAVWGCALNGSVRWEGEENDDTGTIYVRNNHVKAVKDSHSNSKPSWF